MKSVTYRQVIKSQCNSYINNTIIQMACFRFVCVHNSWSCLKVNGFVYAYVDVAFFSKQNH